MLGCFPAGRSRTPGSGCVLLVSEPHTEINAGWICANVRQGDRPAFMLGRFPPPAWKAAARLLIASPSEGGAPVDGDAQGHIKFCAPRSLTIHGFSAGSLNGLAPHCLAQDMAPAFAGNTVLGALALRRSDSNIASEGYGSCNIRTISSVSGAFSSRPQLARGARVRYLDRLSRRGHERS